MAVLNNELAEQQEGLMPPELANIFRARARTMRVKRDQLLISEGAEAGEVYLIISGVLRASVLSLGGWETVFRDMGPGELVGELAAIDGKVRSASVAAVKDTILAAMSAEVFRAFLTEVPKAGFWMSCQLTTRVRDLTLRNFEMATLPVSGRLISELLRLPFETTDLEDRRSLVQVPTHANLAARIGTHRETVSRELGDLAKDGFLEKQGKTLMIPSVRKLKALLDRH